jgi:phosphoribosyl 1,2-cyclic phosphate phosphodiesterase
MVQLTILGCGTSTGVPLISCKCAVCRSRNPKNRRLRASAWVRTRDKSFLIDTSTDLRQQALTHKIPRVDAVLYTHPHADHIHGIDELRSYNYVQRATIPLYGNSWTASELRERFNYIFNPGPVEGGGIPLLSVREFSTDSREIDVLGVPVIPISLRHGSKECVGYRIDSVAYLTDLSELPDASIERLKGLSALVLDCLRLAPHGTHFHLEKALETAAKIGAKKTYLTHLGHDFDYAKWVKKLPKGISLAYDGLKITSGR